MKTTIALLIYLSPIVLSAQNQSLKSNDTIQSSVQWITNLTWKKIAEKAQQERKYIFVDCYATWCGPCQAMDRYVFSRKDVGELINANFIAVKVQMDTTKGDNQEVRNWYKDASWIKQQNNIAALPSYLFFSPNGKLVHRATGFQYDADFKLLAKNALDPNKEYYPLLQKYLDGEKNFSAMPYLANCASSNLEKELAHTIAQDYINNYMLSLNDSLFFTQDNVMFIARYTSSSKDKAFRLFLEQPSKMDHALGQSDWANDVVSNIISKEEIKPYLWKDTVALFAKPDWVKLASNIKRKYGRYHAERSVLLAKIEWYEKKKDWKRAIPYRIENANKYGLDTAGIGKSILNNIAYLIFFMHSNKKEELNDAVKWMEILLKIDPNHVTWIDTYANLLYKLGRVDEAVRWETKAVDLENQVAIKTKQQPDKSYEEILNKMKKGLPTWE